MQRGQHTIFILPLLLSQWHRLSALFLSLFDYDPSAICLFMARTAEPRGQMVNSFYRLWPRLSSYVPRLIRFKGTPLRNHKGRGKGRKELTTWHPLSNKFRGLRCINLLQCTPVTDHYRISTFKACLFSSLVFILYCFINLRQKSRKCHFFN